MELESCSKPRPSGVDQFLESRYFFVCACEKVYKQSAHCAKWELNRIGSSLVAEFEDMGDWMKKKLRPLKLKLFDLAPVPSMPVILRRLPSFKDGDDGSLVDMTSPAWVHRKGFISFFKISATFYYLTVMWLFANEVFILKCPNNCYNKVISQIYKPPVALYLYLKSKSIKI